MKRLWLLIIITILLTSCGLTPSNTYYPTGQKKVEVVITDINIHKWFAGTWHCRINVDYYNEEYNLKGSDEIVFSGMYAPWQYDLKKGDSAIAYLYYNYDSAHQWNFRLGKLYERK